MRHVPWSGPCPASANLTIGDVSLDRSLLAAIGRVTIIRLPELYLHDRKSLAHREVVNELCDVLGSGVYVHDEERLALLLEKRQSGVILVQEHLVIEMLVDPAAEDTFDLREIADHAENVQTRRRQRDHGTAVVPEQTAT